MGKNRLTRSPCHVLSRLSRPPRGAVMRRRESGAGCGTRERGKRKPRPRAALGKPPRGTKTVGSVRLAVNAKAVMPRGASRDAGARVMCARDPALRARPSDRAVRRNPDNAPSRRATPLIARGRKETGSPAPDPKSGTSIALAFQLRAPSLSSQASERSETRDHNQRIIDSARGMGPRFRGDDNGKNGDGLPAPRGHAQHRARLRSRGPTGRTPHARDQPRRGE